MQTPSLPSLASLRTEARNEYRERSRQRLFRRAVAGLLIAILSFIGGVFTHWALRPDRGALTNPVELFEDEQRALSLLRPLGYDWVNQFSTSDLKHRFTLSTEAIALAASVDQLPGSERLLSNLPNWTGLSEPNRIGRSQTIEIFMRMVANEPERDRADVIRWISAFAAASSEGRDFLRWFASVSAHRRKAIDKAIGSVLTTSNGADTIALVANIPGEHLDSINVVAGYNRTEWKDLNRFLAGSRWHRLTLAKMASMAPQRLGALETIEALYPESFDNSALHPYPCLDRVRDQRTRDGELRGYCTIRIQ